MPVVSDKIVPKIQPCGYSKLFSTAKETEEPEEVKVEGVIPTYVRGGKYYRVGPGKFDFPDFTMNHWLDGYAVLTKFEFKEESIAFACKFIQSDAYKRALAQQKPAIGEFATRACVDPKKGFFARMIASLLPEFTDNSYSTLFGIKSDVFSTCDTQFFQRINNALGVDCKFDTQKQFGMNGHCAHPLTDSKGDVYNMGFTIGATGIKYHALKLPFADTSDEMIKKGKIIQTIPSRWMSLFSTIHSFGMTENYLILVEHPYVISTKRIAASFVKSDTLKDWIEWRPEEKNKFYIIEKSTGKVWKTDIMSESSFYFMHFVNSYEDPDSNQMVLDIIVYDSPKVLDGLYMSALRENTHTNLGIDLPYIQRFVIPMIPDMKSANTIENVNLITGMFTNCTAIRNGNKLILSGEKIAGSGVDLPIINRQYQGKKYRYAYAAGTFHESEYINTVIKVDVETKEVLKWRVDENVYPGEPYFIPDPNGEEEDDGVLLVAYTDKRYDQQDGMVILNAKNLNEVTKISLKHHVPCSLHGIYVK